MSNYASMLAVCDLILAPKGADTANLCQIMLAFCDLAFHIRMLCFYPPFFMEPRRKNRMAMNSFGLDIDTFEMV